MDDGTPAPFGDLLRQYRRAARLTQEALAERAGLAARGIQDLERGVRFPYRDTLLRLIAALGLSGADRERLTEAARPRRASRVGLATVQRDRAATRLPVPLTSLIGRDREAAEVQRLLRGARLVTLTGPGGVGKTRLALRVAASVQDSFEGGAVFVEIAAVTEAEAVLPLVVQALGIRETSGQTPLDVLEDYLRNKSILLVLDNFEHVLPASAGDGIAAKGAKDAELARRVADVLEHCPRLRVLVTSRQALRVQGEQEYLVPPLRLPEPDSPPPERLEEYEAIRLYVERARAARYDFPYDAVSAPAIVEICRRLDGLPLAIELAAARAKILTPNAMLARLSPRLPLLAGGLRDAPERHQTLRATIAWSYNLLSPAQQALFGRLGVFSGGWTLEAAEAVCGSLDGEDVSVLEGLAALLDKSLIRREETPGGDARFSMLETIREFALEQLETLGLTAALRNRHLEWCVGLAEEAEPELTGPRQSAWLMCLTTEHDNALAALRCAEEAGHQDQGIRLAGALCEFWVRRGRIRDVRGWLEKMLAACPTRTAAHAKAMRCAGVLAQGQGDYRRANELYERALEEYVDEEDALGIASCKQSLARLHLGQGNYRRAEELEDEALAIYRQVGDRPHQAQSLTTLGNSACSKGTYELAERLHREALALRQTLGDELGIADSLGGLGNAAYGRGAFDAAERCHHQSLDIRRALRDRQGIARSLAGLGQVAAARGSSSVARRLHEEALAIRREIGAQAETAVSLRSLGDAVATQGDLVEAERLYQEALDIHRRLENPAGCADALLGLARLEVARGLSDRAVRAFALASAEYDTVGFVLPEPERQTYDREVAELRAFLGDDAFAAAWAAGQGLKARDVTDGSSRTAIVGLAACAPA